MPILELQLLTLAGMSLAVPAPEDLSRPEPAPLRQVQPAAADPTLRLALPPGMAPPRDWQDTAARSSLLAEEWRVDDGTPALYINDQPAAGPGHGIANRFDPADSWEESGVPPRPLRINKIFFWVNGTGEPTGPMEWHIWEDNGGHKADESRDIVTPFTVTGGPGVNTIDLQLMGIDVVIDPPRMFQVGVANKVSNAGSPDILIDDGLPYVGDTGDFHASLTYQDQYCGNQWGILATGDLGDGQGPRAPVWMIWLEVEWLQPPASFYFEELSAGDFGGASRIAWGDYDNDGDEDLLANGRTLYRNDGAGAFVDVTAAAGIDDTGNGGLWADYDNDGDLDFYQYTPNCVPCGNSDNPDDLWRNNGDGSFSNVREVDYAGDLGAPVPHDPLPTEAAAWGDFNNDGYLDLYTANHVDWSSGDCYDDYLWLNLGPPSYGFRDVSVESGIRAEGALCGRGVNAADFDADGDLDIFVSNYRLVRDLLWVNQGNDADGVPQFSNLAASHGVEGNNASGAYGHSIGSVWGDLDGDEDLDLAVGNLAHSAWLCFSDPSMLYESSGPAGGHQFSDRRVAAGVDYNEVHSDASLVDLDNDGWLDLHLTHVYDGWRSSTWRNLGVQPFGFEDITAVSGIWPRRSWGSGWSDIDLDGDMDLAARGMWRNLASESGQNHWLQVELVGCGRSNRDAIGSTLILSSASATSRQLREVYGARGTGSQDSRIQHFGLGSNTSFDELEVRFPSGDVQLLAGDGADQRLRVVELGAWLRVTPASPCIDQPVQLTADTCGATRTLDWDLDGDGQFDDASGPTASTAFPSAGTHVVSVQVGDGSSQVVQSLEIEVGSGGGTPPEDPGNSLTLVKLGPDATSLSWTAPGSLPAGGNYLVRRASGTRPPFSDYASIDLSLPSYDDQSASGTLAWEVRVEDACGGVSEYP